MDNIIEINNLNFKYNDNIIFEDLNLSIKKSSFTTIIGKNNSGKSTLSKIILGIIKTDSNIKIDHLNLNNNIKKIRNNIGYIPSNVSDSFLMDTVYDEIIFSNKIYNKKELNLLINEYNLNNLLDKNPRTLSGGEGELVYLISILLRKPKLIIIDEAFSMLDNLVKDKVLKSLKKLSKEENITIVNITNDTEDTVYGDYIAIIDNKKIIVNDKKEEILSNEKLFKNLDLKLPFMAELSIKLKYYDLINNLELDMNKMVNKLWK